MDPVAMIVNALVMGAAAAASEIGGQALKDAYAGFRALVLRRFGTKPDVKRAIEAVEKKPESEGRQRTAEEELTAVGAADDVEVVQAAKELLEALKKQGATGGKIYKARATGGSAIAQGDGSIAAAGGSVVVKGKVKGDIKTSRTPKV